MFVYLGCSKMPVDKFQINIKFPFYFFSELWLNNWNKFHNSTNLLFLFELNCLILLPLKKKKNQNQNNS